MDFYLHLVYFIMQNYPVTRELYEADWLDPLLCINMFFQMIYSQHFQLKRQVNDYKYQLQFRIGIIYSASKELERICPSTLICAAIENKLGIWTLYTSLNFVMVVFFYTISCFVFTFLGLIFSAFLLKLVLFNFRKNIFVFVHFYISLLYVLL